MLESNCACVKFGIVKTIVVFAARAPKVYCWTLALPVGPCGPVGPVAPGVPLGPCGPVAPVLPVAQVGPVGPGVPPQAVNNNAPAANAIINICFMILLVRISAVNPTRYTQTSND